MSRRTPAGSLAVLAVAAILRLGALDGPSLDGDEIYTHYDVQEILAGRPWAPGARTAPLGYLLIAGAAALAGAGELGLRLVPALAGVGMVAALLGMRRDVVPRHAALGAGALAACSPWLLYHSQEARFYGPLLLFATLATLWALPGPARAPGRALLAWAAAVLCHPTALLLGPGLLAPLFVGQVSRRRALSVLAVVVVAAGSVWLLAGEAFLGVTRRAWEGSDPGHYGPGQLVLGLGYNLGPITGLLALGGVASLLAGRDRRGAVLLTAAALPPVVLLALGMAFGLSMHQRYALAAVPAVLLLAGEALAALAVRRPRTAALAGALALAAFAPGLAAHVRDGNRHDWRAAAAWLAERSSPDDIVVADEHAALHLYLSRQPGFADVSLHEENLVDESKRYSFVRNRREVWVVLKLSRFERGYGADFTAWLQTHFVEVARIGTSPPPLVQHDNRLVVLRRKERVRGASPLPGTGDG